MTSYQLIAWQERLDLSQVAAARLLNVPPQTYRNWIYGRTEVPRTVTKLCAYVERFGPLEDEA
jgi:Predicted transcriptional regulator